MQYFQQEDTKDNPNSSIILPSNHKCNHEIGFYKKSGMHNSKEILVFSSDNLLYIFRNKYRVFCGSVLNDYR